MDNAKTNEALNRLYAIHNRSLPKYISYARPWPAPGDEEAWKTIELIVADQKRMIERIGEMLDARNCNVAVGEYPIWYTGLNDLSLDYLIGRMIEKQEQDIGAIQQCVDQLNLDPMAQTLAKEALGAAKGHLDSLVELSEKEHSPVL